MKILKFCFLKDTFKTMNTQATNWEKIVAKETSDEGLLSTIYDEHLQLKKQAN